MCIMRKLNQKPIMADSVSGPLDGLAFKFETWEEYSERMNKGVPKHLMEDVVSEMNLFNQKLCS